MASRSTNDTAIRRLRHRATIVLSVTAGLALAACGSSSAPLPHLPPTAHIAYLSFAVENSYDAPMLAAPRPWPSDTTRR